MNTSIYHKGDAQAIIEPYKSEAGGSASRGDVTTEAKVLPMQTQCKECWQPLQVGKGKNHLLP